MDVPEYDNQLYLLLGVQGPMGTLPCPEGILLAYHLPDGGVIYLTPADKMMPEQRQETIEHLREHLGLVAQKRKPDTPEGLS